MTDLSRLEDPGQNMPLRPTSRPAHRDDSGALHGLIWRVDRRSSVRGLYLGPKKVACHNAESRCCPCGAFAA